MFENKNSSTQNLGQNKHNATGLGQAPANQSKDIDIHVMPGKFLPQVPDGKSNGGGSGGAKKKISLVVVLLVLFLVILVGGGIWLIMNQDSVFGGDDQPITNNQPVENTNTNQNTNTNTNTNTNVNENQNTNTNTNTNTSLPETSALDTDEDGLTQEEEIVFGTSVNDDDTDKDGFRDGQEVANMYNPLIPRESLQDSGLVSPYINASFDYSILIPSTWLAQDILNDDARVVILPDSEVGDSILIEVAENTEEWTLNQWKNSEYPEAVFENYTVGGQAAFLSSNGLFLMMATTEYRYTIQYRLSDVDNIYYPTIFEMILNSFSLEKTPNTVIDE